MRTIIAQLVIKGTPIILNCRSRKLLILVLDSLADMALVCFDNPSSSSSLKDKTHNPLFISTAACICGNIAKAFTEPMEKDWKEKQLWLEEFERYVQERKNL
ncbi:unnamed protein product [Cochlearia groenlandica]